MLARRKKKVTRKRCKRLTRKTKAIEEEARQKYNPDDLFKNKKNEKLAYKE